MHVSSLIIKNPSPYSDTTHQTQAKTTHESEIRISGLDDKITLLTQRKVTDKTQVICLKLFAAVILALGLIGLILFLINVWVHLLTGD